MLVLAYSYPMSKIGPEVVGIAPFDEKDVIFWPASLTEEIKKDWPVEMRKQGGFQLGRIQQGLRRASGKSNE